MTINRDDNMIGGAEFRVRRLALGLTQGVILEHLKVQRSALDRWQQGRSRIPSKARKMLDMVESDVEATIDYLVETETTRLSVQPAEEWPWGNDTWYVVIARARQRLAESGLAVLIN